MHRKYKHNVQPKPASAPTSRVEETVEGDQDRASSVGTAGAIDMKQRAGLPALDVWFVDA